MLFNVVKGMLGNVGKSTIGVFFDGTFGWFHFTGEQFDHGGFTGAVGTDTGDTGSHGALDGNTGQLWLGGTRVSKITFVHLQNGGTFGFDTVQNHGLWKCKFHFGFTEFKVRFAFGETFDQDGNVAFVTVQF